MQGLVASPLPLDQVELSLASTGLHLSQLFLMVTSVMEMLIYDWILWLHPWTGHACPRGLLLHHLRHPQDRGGLCN